MHRSSAQQEENSMRLRPRCIGLNDREESCCFFVCKEFRSSVAKHTLAQLAGPGMEESIVEVLIGCQLHAKMVYGSSTGTMQMCQGTLGMKGVFKHAMTTVHDDVLQSSAMKRREIGRLAHVFDEVELSLLETQSLLQYHHEQRLCRHEARHIGSER